MTTDKNAAAEAGAFSHSKAIRRLLAAAALLAVAATLGFASPKKEAPAPSSSNPAATAPLVAAPGVLVTAVQAGSPADKAGVARGDIILEADGKTVNTPPELAAAINAKKAGDTLSLKLRHGDNEKTATVTLGAEAGRAWLGIEAEGGRFGFGRMPGYGRFGGNGFYNNGPGGNGPGLMLRASGAYISAVTAGSPAEKAGLAQGDVILSVDGTAIDAQHVLADLIAAKKVGDTVTLSVRSAAQAQPRDVQVTLGKNPDKDAPWLGLQYSLVGPGMGRMAPGLGGGGWGIQAAGVVVAQVTAGSPAEKAGIKNLDVITNVDGAAVTDPQQVVDAVAKHKPGDTLPVTVTRAGSSVDLSVVLGASPSDAAKAYMGVSMNDGGQRMMVPRGSTNGANPPTL